MDVGGYSWVIFSKGCVVATAGSSLAWMLVATAGASLARDVWRLQLGHLQQGMCGGYSWASLARDVWRLQLGHLQQGMCGGYSWVVFSQGSVVATAGPL